MVEEHAPAGLPHAHTALVALHDGFSAEIRGFLEAYRAGDEELAGKIVEYLKDWIVTHILAKDADYKKSVTAGGARPSPTGKGRPG